MPAPRSHFVCRVCGELKPRADFDFVTYADASTRPKTRCRECLKTERRGNFALTEADIPPPNPSGLCLCGCGEKTPLAKASHRAIGNLRGHPVRYLTGHNRRAAPGQQWDPDANGCHIWRGRLDEHGYGMTNGADRAVAKRAHTVAWIRVHGPVPTGRVLHHRCLNPACVNPAHLVCLTPVEHQAAHTRLTAVALNLPSDRDA